MYTLSEDVWGYYFDNIKNISRGIKDLYEILSDSGFQLIVSPGDTRSGKTWYYVFSPVKIYSNI